MSVKSKLTKPLLKEIIKRTNGNVRKAAALACDVINEQVSPELLRYYLNKLGNYKEEPKILLFDIETAPMKVYSWGLWQQDIGLPMIIKDWYVLCWSAKWLHENKVHHDALYLHEDYVSEDDCEYNVIESIWTMLDSCDIAVAQNGKGFDKKKLNAKFLQYGFPEPTYKIVDTLLIARGNFALSSNKLDFITKKLGGGGKIKTDFSLWEGCMNGDSSAWKKMVKYCDTDVKELEHVYLSLRAWDKQSPNYGQYLDGDTLVCNACGHPNLSYDKDMHTGVSTYEVYACDECGKKHRTRKSVKKTQTMVNI